MAQDSIKLPNYLFARLRQLGIQSIFGVPGDYNLRLLDYVEPSGLHWVGNCNELNAAYAADGYARINGLGALITTFGVGELSAINGIAGANAEKAPVIHIVGTPSRALQDSRAMVHHTFADGEYGRFAAMHAHITVAQANLTDPRTAAEQIDWALQQALVKSRPVYIQLPDDMVDVAISSTRLDTPISIPSAPSPKHEEFLMTRILDRMYLAKRPMIFVDGETRPLKIIGQAEELVQRTGWPTWTSGFGKGLVNEQLDNVYGFYFAGYGDEQSKKYFDSADLALVLGPHYTNTNTQGYTTIPNKEASISFTESSVHIGNDIYRDISIRQFLTHLLQRMDPTCISTVDSAPPKPILDISHIKDSDLITQEGFYRFVNRLFSEGDIVLTETGTASYGGREFVLPPNTRTFAAITWLSIGYMLPATLGAALAQQETSRTGATGNVKRRAFLFIGDGSLQMTVQEISTIIREKLDVTIFILNNAGYTIERAIHGRKQAYNDITSWRHLQALSFFGATDQDAAQNNFSARTYGDLEQVLQSEPIRKGSGLRVVEVYMDREDCQGLLKTLMQQQIAGESAGVES
ncbi:thiamine diphosphate-binding protein [Aspergillus avenaceus]|uniref:Pyruvate decarboxylase n=1 Tax=Aspergillus avenaceus TaxID=36643 RepID=A0A5N6TQH8_ASPAV|nr:thiamine diphosphate-binding protein [Aspergillus avenaceus]